MTDPRDERYRKIMASLYDFYSMEDAEKFMVEPQKLLGGRRPVDLIQTEDGYAEVDSMLARLRDGAHV